jgi:hypothetical protein
MLYVYLTLEGQEKLATGKELNSWHFQVGQGDYTPEYSVLLGSFKPTFPAAEDCVTPALENITRQEKAVKAQAQRDLQSLLYRRNDLLLLGSTK